MAPALVSSATSAAKGDEWAVPQGQNTDLNYTHWSERVHAGEICVRRAASVYQTHLRATIAAAAMQDPCVTLELVMGMSSLPFPGVCP